jgi:hypothetical protein
MRAAGYCVMSVQKTASLYHYYFKLFLSLDTDRRRKEGDTQDVPHPEGGGRVGRHQQLMVALNVNYEMAMKYRGEAQAWEVSRRRLESLSCTTSQA